MQNARLDEAQVLIKISGRNINNLRYADDTTLMAESEEELKSLLMKVQFSSVQSLSCVQLFAAGVQPRLIQGIRRGDGIGDQETTAYLNVN